MAADRHVSPLGRYDPGSTGPLHEVRLIGLPVRLFAAGRQHHQELVRELRLLALADPGAEHLSARLTAVIDGLGARQAALTERADAEIDAALLADQAAVDVTYRVPTGVVAAAERLEQAMAEADRFCRERRLLTLARTEAQQRFGAWYLGEFRRQIDGEPPTRWDGPLDL